MPDERNKSAEPDNAHASATATVRLYEMGKDFFDLLRDHEKRGGKIIFDAQHSGVFNGRIAGLDSAENTVTIELSRSIAGVTIGEDAIVMIKA